MKLFSLSWRYFCFLVWGLRMKIATFEHISTSFPYCSSNSETVWTALQITASLISAGLWWRVCVGVCVFLSHPERVVLLGQVGEDVGVEHSGLQEAAPQSSQLGAELAHIPADLLSYFFMTVLQLKRSDIQKRKKNIFNIKQNELILPKYLLRHSLTGFSVFLPTDSYLSAVSLTCLWLRERNSSVNKLENYTCWHIYISFTYFIHLCEVMLTLFIT